MTEITTQKIVLSVPPDMDFADLQLSRRDDGNIRFKIETVERLCLDNELEPSLVLSSEGNVCELIVRWYAAHRANGGDPDPVAEDIAKEILIELEHGQAVSFAPGRA